MNSTDGYSYGKIIALASPMILANISTPLLGIVDTAILGHLQTPLYLGAVAVGANLITLLFWMFGFLRMGTTSFASRLFGAGDNTGLRDLLLRTFAIALSISALLLLLHPWLIWSATRLLSEDPSLNPLVIEYANIRIWSAPATLLTYCIVGWFIGLQRTSVPLVILLAVNLLNIALDYLLIVVFGLNSRGAALATLISEYVGLVVALSFLWHQLKRMNIDFQGVCIGVWSDYRDLIQVNSDLFVRTLLLLCTFLFFISRGTALGQETLAANAILLALLSFSAYALDGFAYAAEALVGESVGRRDQRRYWLAIDRTSRLAVGIAIGCTILLYLGQKPILWLFTDLSAVIEIASEHYLWLAFLPLVAVGCYQLDGVFIGAGYSRAMRNSMVFSVIAVFLPVWALSRDWGNHGLWLALFLFHIARFISLAVLLLVRYRHLPKSNEPTP